MMPRSTVVHTTQSNVSIESIKKGIKPIFDEVVQKRIDSVWNELNEKRQGLYNGTLLRVSTSPHSIDSGQMVIQVVPDMTYKEIVGLRYTDGEFASGLDTHIPLQVLSAYILVQTSDKHLFFIDRDCGDWKAALEFPGGFIQEKHNINDVAEFAYMRAASDLGIEKGFFSGAICHGYIDAKDIFELVLVYSVQCSLTFEELKKNTSVAIYEISSEYTLQTHSEWFEKQILIIMQITIDGFLDSVRSNR